MENKLQLDSELRKLVSQINQREQVIESAKSKTTNDARIFLTEVILQGQDLIAAKAKIPHGMWLDWLKSHCPNSVKMAQRYMSAARKCEDPTIGDFKNFRELLDISFTDQDGEIQVKNEPKHWPPFYEAFRQITKVSRIFVKATQAARNRYRVQEGCNAGLCFVSITRFLRIGLVFLTVPEVRRFLRLSILILWGIFRTPIVLKGCL